MYVKRKALGVSAITSRCCEAGGSVCATRVICLVLSTRANLSYLGMNSVRWGREDDERDDQRQIDHAGQHFADQIGGDIAVERGVFAGQSVARCRDPPSRSVLAMQRDMLLIGCGMDGDVVCACVCACERRTKRRSFSLRRKIRFD